MPVRELIKKAHVKLIGSTDDILDPLKAHDTIRSDPSFDVTVVPTFRTDSVVNIGLPGFSEYLGKLSDVAGCAITDFAGLAKAIRIRMDDFAKRGCRSIDQALMDVPCTPFTREEIDRILKKALAGGIPTKQEEDIYLCGLLFEIASACKERDWVMQLHVGAKRDNNSYLLRTVGVDVGGDCIGSFGNLSMLPQFMDALNEACCLPKMILYSINPADNPVLDSMIGCFQEAGTVGKIQHGAAWWFSDNLNGIRNHLTSLASLSVLGNFIGTLTDSRAYVNYSRHDYFRRILCDTVGEWIDRGEYPKDIPFAGSMIQDICWRNVNRYFGFGL
ncbi:glucuronate isomerase [Clostridium sp. AM58-1XD]|nr:glucuronate isomerase [Clostridium sp. AM58-1XD]